MLIVSFPSSLLALLLNVYIVNEIATMLILGGITAPKVGESNFQELLIKMQLETEKIYAYTITYSKIYNNIFVKTLAYIFSLWYDVIAYFLGV